MSRKNKLKRYKRQYASNIRIAKSADKQAKELNINLDSKVFWHIRQSEKIGVQYLNYKYKDKYKEELG